MHCEAAREGEGAAVREARGTALDDDALCVCDDDECVWEREQRGCGGLRELETVVEKQENWKSDPREI